MQRSIFFGTPSRAPASDDALSSTTFAQATAFLDGFYVTTSHLFPFFSKLELSERLRELYGGGGSSGSSQKMAVMLAVLAIGALTTPRTDLAELLYARAKTCAAPYDEAVTLSMIKFSLLCADYQLNLGRPNSTYVHLGTACRKAFAFGLHKETTGLHVSDEELTKRRSTMWCLYFHERYPSPWSS